MTHLLVLCKSELQLFFFQISLLHIKHKQKQKHNTENMT